MMEQAYLEVIPTRNIVKRLAYVSAHSWVGISCSPSAGVGPTLDTVDRLHALQKERCLKLVPHIAARVVRDKGHLREILTRLEEAGVKAVFVPGGDSPKPVGEYSSALDLLREMAEIGHEFEDIGIAAYPEGHPLLDKAELLRLMQEKQAFATYLVTQMCFDSGVMINWLRGIRMAGMTMPAWLGLPGVVEIPRLVALSLKIGVGQSVRVLRKQNGLARKLISGRAYRPDDLLEGLRHGLSDPDLGVQGFHLYSFNNVEATERWRVDTINRLNGSEQQIL